MSISIGCMNYGYLTQLYHKVESGLPEDVRLVHIEGIFEDTVKRARELERDKAVDVFLTSGSNAQLVRDSTTLPLVEIKPTGFDILLALERARAEGAQRVAVITFRRPLATLDQVKHLFPLEVITRSFGSSRDMDAILDSLLAEGVRHVVGGHLACSRTHQKGMWSHNLVSEGTLSAALDQAIAIARARKQEMTKTQQLHTVLESVHEAIVAVDERGIITLFNRHAEQILHIREQDALGKPSSRVIPNSRLERVLETRQAEINQIQVIGNTKILTNRMPIVVKDDVTGVVATFQTINAVQEAEHKIRRDLYARGFVAQHRFGDILGSSKALHAARTKAERFAPSDATVLIQGESGTGKELFAQSIHNASRRAMGPFVSVNCGAFPTGLLESELFGYEEGAFTGAKRGGKPGVFELAHEGTIFLDEIGEMSMDIQARLLRVLEARELFRIGSDRMIRIDVRVIAATNKDLPEMVRQGLFREDLYYRIHVLALYLPPLRERREDVPALMAHFLSGMREDLSPKQVDRMVKSARLHGCAWEGNVRQIRNLCEQIAALYTVGDDFGRLLEDLGFSRQEELSADGLLQALERFDGNKTRAAQHLGISRATLWRRLRELDS